MQTPPPETSVPLWALAALEFSVFGRSPAVEPRGRKRGWGRPCPPHLPAPLGGGSGSTNVGGRAGCPPGLGPAPPFLPFSFSLG